MFSWLSHICFWGAHHQFAMLHSLYADQAARQLLYPLELALDHHHFQAHVVIEMRMHSRNDEFVVFVLQFH